MALTLKLTSVLLATALTAEAAAVSPAEKEGLGVQPQRQSQTSRPPVRHQQQHHAGDWLRKYKDMPADQQQKALESDPDFRRLPPDRQQKLRERLLHFKSLPPQKQNAILDRMEIWEHLTNAQKQQAKSLYTRIRQLPADRRTQVINAIHDLRQMDPQQRQATVDSEAFGTTYNEQERNILKGVLELPLRPAPKSESAPTPQSAPQQ